MVLFLSKEILELHFIIEWVIVTLEILQYDYNTEKFTATNFYGGNWPIRNGELKSNDIEFYVASFQLIRKIICHIAGKGA